MQQRVFDGGLQVTQLAAAVIALALEAVGKHGLFLQQALDGIGQLDLAAGSARDFPEVPEDARIEHIAPDHGKVGSRILRLWFLDDAFQAGDTPLALARVDDAVLVGLVVRHLLDAKHAAPAVMEHRQHLPEHAVLRGIDQVVGQDHGERLVADDRGGAQHGVAEPERLRLAYVDAGYILRHHVAHDSQQPGLALALQLAFQLVVLVEVVLDRALAAAGDKDQFLDAGLDRLFRRILDQRLVDHGQHFLGIGLGCRQKTGTETRYRKNRLAYFTFHNVHT